MDGKSWHASTAIQNDIMNNDLGNLVGMWTSQLCVSNISSESVMQGPVVILPYEMVSIGLENDDENLECTLEYVSVL